MHQHVPVIHYDPYAVGDSFDAPYFFAQIGQRFLFDSRAMASTCVVESALQITKAGHTAPSKPLRSSDMMFFPFCPV